MAWVKEASNVSSASSATCVVTVPTGGFPSGHLLVVGAVAVVSGASNPNLTVTDSQGNTWVNDRTIAPITGQNTYVTLTSTIVTTTLNAGDTITVTGAGNTPNRIAVTIQEFDDTISGKDTGSTNDNGGTSSASVNSGSFTTANADNLIVNVVGLVSAARIPTAGTNYTLGTKVASTNGTGDRAVYAQWRYVTSTGSYTTPSTLNTGSIYGSLGQGYIISTGGGGGPRTGKAKVWNGSAWVSHPVKVWNGSSWVEHPAKGHDGTQWVIGK